MKPLNLKSKKSAKVFLLRVVPAVLDALNLNPLTMKLIEGEARRRIYAMSEESAIKVLDTLKGMLEKW